MKKEDWIWMPHAGHFIGAAECLFRLNTYVGRYIVTSVGEYFPDPKGPAEPVDLRRGYRYETMVFKAVKTKRLCCPYVAEASYRELDGDSYKTAGAAMEGHLALCEKWSRKE